MSDIKSKLVFEDYIVEKVELNANLECDKDDIDIKFDIDSDVNFVNENDFLLNLSVEIFKDAKKNNFPFSLSVMLTGIFSIKGVKQEEKMDYAEKNAVAILFPYVRALVTNYTAASNISPLILPPINVAQYLQNKRKQAKK
ncbi:protein-export chaperone SecB [uncultured Clostridium sp.]|uniref:protein-export chaperone SecB n=1 Tax=uncultured Clostridium sp. TaxID=59620 RepID=UPI00258BA95E|nr:protein-export chaperone SecB [uncultured Clostridium sp.]